MSQVKLNRILNKLSEAEGYLMLEMPQRALEILNAQDDWATMKFEACLLQGEAWRMMERYREALIPLEAAAALKPADVNVAISLGWCYKRTNQLAQAIDALMRAVREHPGLALLHYNLACYWSLAGDVNKATNFLSLATKIDPQFCELMAKETDFNPIRHEPIFERLVERLSHST